MTKSYLWSQISSSESVSSDLVVVAGYIRECDAVVPGNPPADLSHA